MMPSNQPDSDLNNLLCFQNPKFAEPSFEQKIFHGFFSRQGGVSTGLYESLNCGLGSNDDKAAVLENLSRVSGAAGVSVDHLLTLYQIHSADCVSVDMPWAWEDRPKADAFVTKTPGLALGVLTADCAPVLFSGQDDAGAPVIGAAHAGWGGAFKDVLQGTVRAMQDLGADLQSIKAVIGPCIAQKSYEVGGEFIEKFIEQDEANEFFFKSARKEYHMMFDLSGYCAARLAMCGVKTVLIEDRDTYADEANFFSYRRATHRSEIDYGRQISVISIPKPITE